MYAAEAYHTKGAMRHVVGVLQLKNMEINNGMTMIDYWVSMIENWADANKVFGHCGNKKVTECLLSMAKYLYRTFDALTIIKNTLCNTRKLINALKVAFKETSTECKRNNINVAGEKFKYWIANYKGRMTDLPPNELKQFVRSVGCPPQDPGLALKVECMNKIQNLVKGFNDLLVKTTGRKTTENTIMYKKNGKKKEMPIYLMLN